MRRTAVCLVVFALLGAAGGLWWSNSRRASIQFLPPMRPAEWIIYPAALDMRIHNVFESATIFKTSFTLDRVPTNAVLKIAAFHRYTLQINGKTVVAPLNPQRNWKRPVIFSVAADWVAGTNRMAVTVINSNGPPALWVSMVVDNREINSQKGWESSYAGAAWRPATLASEPKVTIPGSPIYGGDEPW
ncbi:MAG TPA: hypothetical protein VFD66_02755, partial [Verrucomicrobiae bacterium]|nr:hypothetical protein [Verrucomicrobiae bacterium]